MPQSGLELPRELRNHELLILLSPISESAGITSRHYHTSPFLFVWFSKTGLLCVTVRNVLHCQTLSYAKPHMGLQSKQTCSTLQSWS